jgi:hypothetical protein
LAFPSVFIGKKVSDADAQKVQNLKFILTLMDVTDVMMLHRCNKPIIIIIKIIC